MIEQALTDLFNNNFCAYWRSHVAHVNIVGRNFVSDHKLLGKIYEDLQGQIDVIAELLRTVEAPMPNDLHEVHKSSSIGSYMEESTDIDYLESVYDDVETLIDQYIDLQKDIGDDYRYAHISNYAQDRVSTLQKFCWMLRSTIDSRSY